MNSSEGGQIDTLLDPRGLYSDFTAFDRNTLARSGYSCIGRNIDYATEDEDSVYFFERGKNDSKILEQRRLLRVKK